MDDTGRAVYFIKLLSSLGPPGRSDTIAHEIDHVIAYMSWTGRRDARFGPTHIEQDARPMLVRATTAADRDTVRDIHRDAFGPDEGSVIAQLTLDLLDDPTAAPRLSLLAEQDASAVGHVLFTRAALEPARDDLRAAILAPLAVRPPAHNLGVGSALVRDGLARLAADGVALVFVLGHPDYYPRFWFRPAGALGLDAPYEIAPQNAGAWMVRPLRDGVLGAATGTVRCAQVLDRPEHWQE